MKRFTIILISILICYPDVLSQKELKYVSNPVKLQEFLSSVGKGNLGYITEQFNVDIAEAELRASKVFPDPGIGVAFTDNQEKTMQMGQSLEAGLSYPVNLGNKRGAGISLARSRHELSTLLLEEYFQNLRANAAIGYYFALRDLKIFQLQQNIYDQMAQLARADSIRLKAGEANALDALQSSLEARSKLTEVHQSLSDMQNSAVQLLFLTGKQFNDTLNIPADDFPNAVRDFNLTELIKSALEKRIELLVAIKNREVSEKNLKLIRAQRSFEFDIEAGYAYNSIVTNEIAPAPAHNSITAGISVPLKFSSLNKGERKAAEIAIQQSQNIAEEAELQVTSEVVMAYNNFTNQNKKLVSYNQGLIEDAERILQGRIYSYRNGETGLLDVLNAQRTYTELHMSYIQALFDYTAALIELERAAGFWDGLL